jgi:glycine cleavage system transcriptional repressor
MAGTTVVVTAVGEDRPGIVAALAKAMYELGANLDDATMTRLHDIFTTMLSAELPEGKTTDDCRHALEAASRETGVVVTVQTVRPDPVHGDAPDHLITVYGADRPGIVYGVAGHLAARGVNITDMDTRRTGSPEAPVYVMLLEVHAGDVDLDTDLDDLRRSLGIDITVQRLDAEAL